MSTLYEWFAAPQPTLGVALARMVLGAVVAFDGWRMLRSYERWYGPDALAPGPSDRARVPRVLDWFGAAARGRRSGRAVLGLMIAAALSFSLGLATPLTGGVLLLTMIVVPLRNPWIVYGGDAFGRTLLLLLLLSPCDHSLAIDRLLDDGTLGLDAQASPWGGRLVLVEVAVLYASNFVVKLRSSDWRRGTVMFDLLHNVNFACAGIPAALRHPAVARAMTWGALAVELGLGPALLYEPTAAIAGAIAIGFHLAIARCLDVHLFSAVMVAGLLACLPASLWSAMVPMTPAEALPPAGLGATIAVGLATAYATHAFMSAFPGLDRPMRWIRRRFAPGLDRIGWGRGWRLFTSSAPTAIEVELTVVHQLGATRRWTWISADDLLGSPPRGRRPDHRLQRFKFSLLREPDARTRLVERFTAALAQTDWRVRAWSIDALSLDVHDGRIVGGRNVGARLGRTPSGELDRDAIRRLADEVRFPATRTTLRALLSAPSPRSPQR